MPERKAKQLDSYSLEVNPANFSLFTGKMLTEETGLVYFGARWYDPEVGRFISPDLEEDGENWYSYCENDPINYVDPDGRLRLSLRGWGILWGGLKVGFKQYALKTAADVATGIVIGSAMAVCMPAIMPTLTAAIPIIVATATYIGIACDIGPDLAFLVREFSTVFLRKNPSDRKVRTYGVKVSKVGLEFAGLLATSQGMKAIMKTGILQKAGIWVNSIGDRGSIKIDEFKRINNKTGKPYPKVMVEGYGEVPLPEGPYTPNNSKNLRSGFTDSFKKQFKEWWISQGRPWPEGEVNIHHIKPLSKGGDNSFENLVPLIHPEQHQPFTNWWRSFP